MNTLTRKPIKFQVHPHETTSFTSPRDRVSPAHNYRKIADQASRQNSDAAGNHQTDARIARLERQKPLTSSGYHPFKIYQLPFQYRTGYRGFQNITSDQIWRTFRVRCGFLVNTDATGVIPDGTDLVDEPYDDIFATFSDGSKITYADSPTGISGLPDVIVPANVPAYYFWLDTSTNTVECGADPTVPDSNGGANPWTNWPVVDGTNIIIGWVDTQTLGAAKQALVRQVLTTDFMGGGGGGPAGMQFKGAYDSATNYAVQDVVVIRDGDINDGSYVCIKNNPGAANPPVQPDTGNQYWVSLSPGLIPGFWF